MSLRATTCSIRAHHADAASYLCALVDDPILPDLTYLNASVSVSVYTFLAHLDDDSTTSRLHPNHLPLDISLTSLPLACYRPPTLRARSFRNSRSPVTFPEQSTSIYNVLFKRNSVMVPLVFTAAFGFSLSYDVATSKWWDNHNKGVSVAQQLGGKVSRIGC